MLVTRRKVNKCQVPGCNDTGSKRHRFPNPKTNMNLFQHWVKNVCNVKLRTLNPDQVYNSYYICNIHFEERYIVPGSLRGLSRIAVPTLNLPVEQGDRNEPISSTSGAQQFSLPGPMLIPQPVIDIQKDEKEPIASTSAIQQSSLLEPVQRGSRIETAISGPSQEKADAHRSVLRRIGLTRAVHLTPHRKVLYGQIVNQAKLLAQSKNKIHNFRRRILMSRKIANNHFRGKLGRLNKATTIFIEQQLRTQGLKPKSRRFTLDEKILSLTLLKSSSKGYTMLSKLFALPSRKTLMRLLNKVPLRPGINAEYFHSLKNMVRKMPHRDRKCVLLFDEISLSPCLAYNQRYDIVDGFQNLGNKIHMPKIADTANVFMVTGICRQWKQPLVFTFSSGPIHSAELKDNIVQIIVECQTIGLDVVATICDQGAGNVAAIRALLNQSREEHIRNNVEFRNVGFTVGDKEIVPLFDVPHLVKGIRNNLLNKDLHYQNAEGETVIAKWEHVINLYDLDCSDTTRMLRLTDHHVIPSKINKMKVSLATQIFSHKVGAIMKRLAGSDIANGILPVQAKDTADFILFMDAVFDSLNGNTKHAPRGKPLKGGISKSSGHLDFYSMAAKKFSTMKFFDNRKNTFVNVPSLRNFKITLDNFKYLTSKLIGMSHSYVLARAFNQDPLENFFSLLRSHGVRNVSPDPSHFITSFKSLIVNNFMAKHSPGANCEEDVSEGLLDNLGALLTGEDILGVTPLADEDVQTTPTFNIVIKSCDRSTVAYIAGYTANKILNVTEHCDVCSQFLLYEGGKAKYCDLIYARQYKNCRFQIPSSALYNCVGLCLCYIYSVLPQVVHKENILKNIQRILCDKIKLKQICTAHNLKTLIITLLSKCILFNYIKDVNGIMTGKYVKKFQMTKDPIKLDAYKKFNKRRK